VSEVVLLARRWLGLLLIAFSCAFPVEATAWADGESPDGPPAAARDAQKSGPRTLLDSIVGARGATDTEGLDGEGRIDPDRPHLPEAVTTVGIGRAVLESGYDYTQRGSFFSHSYPEALLRVGVLAEWFELRIGQNVLTEQQAVDGLKTTVTGAQDMYVGFKVALTEQKQYLPAVAVIPQATLPTGSRSETAGKVLPGLNVDCAWEVIEKLFSVETVVATNRVLNDDHNAQLHGTHLEVTTGLTFVVSATRQLEVFAEWDAFYPVTGSGRDSQPRDYAVGGLVYFFTNNFEMDVRAGVGLNRSANDFLVGTGLAVRY